MTCSSLDWIPFALLPSWDLLLPSTLRFFGFYVGFCFLNQCVKCSGFALSTTSSNFLRNDKCLSSYVSEKECICLHSCMVAGQIQSFGLEIIFFRNLKGCSIVFWFTGLLWKSQTPFWFLILYMCPTWFYFLSESLWSVWNPSFLKFRLYLDVDLFSYIVLEPWCVPFQSVHSCSSVLWNFIQIFHLSLPPLFFLSLFFFPLFGLFVLLSISSSSLSINFLS